MKKMMALFLMLISLSQLMAVSHFTWTGSPTTLSSGTRDASDPQVGIDVSGNVVAAWVENGFIKSKKHPFNGSWSSVVTVSNSGASSPRLVVDQHGNANMVWIENGVIKASMQPFNGSWSTPVHISTTGVEDPQIAVDPNGDVVAIWSRGGIIESSTKFFGGNWPLLPQVIALQGGDSPQIAIGADSRSVVAVWHSVVSALDTIIASDKLTSGEWSTPHVLSQFSINPRVAVDAQGNAVAIWYNFQVSGLNFTNVIVQGATKPAQGNWNAAVNISAPGVSNPVDLVSHVSFDNSGNAIALWNTSFDDSTFVIQSSVLPANGSWTTPLQIVSPNLYAYSFDLSADAIGDAIAVYMLLNGSNLSVNSVGTDIAANVVNWDTAVTLSSGSINGFPRVALSLNGNKENTAAVWINNAAGHNNVLALLGSANVVQPPTSLSVTQHVNNFSIFSEYYNTLTWHASSSPNIAGYVVYRNGVPIVTLGSTATQFKDDNRTQHEPGVYGVAAFDNNHFQSATAIINFPP